MSIRKVWPYAIALVPWFLYVAVAFLAARTGSVKLYGLDPRQLFYVRLASIAFNLVHWLIGTFCVVTLADATRVVTEKRTSFRRIALGVLAMVVGSMVGSNAAALRSVFVGQAEIIKTLTFIYNYSYALSTLVAAALFFSGSGLLAGGDAKVKIWKGWNVIGYVGLVLLMAAHVWLVFTNPDRHVTSPADGIVAYYLPDIVVAVTIVLPYLLAYTLVLFSAFRSAKYFLNSGGIVYKDASRQFVTGQILAMLGIFILQFLLSLGPTRSASLGLFGSLGVVLSYEAFQSAGFLALAFGIRKISAIERAMHAYAQHTPEENRIAEWNAAPKKYL